MNPARNPYSPGAGLRPRELAGRASEIEKFGFLTERAMAGLVSKSLVMTGLRGVGKTVLLNELAATARGSDWVVAKVEADASGKSIGFRAQVAHSLNRSLRELTGSWGTGGKLRRALASFKAFSLTADPTGALSIGIDIDPARGRADTGTLDLDLEELVLDLAEAAQERGVGVVLFIDELQDLTIADLAAVAQACHEAGQRNAQFYVVGAGLPSLPGLLAEAKSYSERLFDYWRIGTLNMRAAKSALVRPAEAEDATWEDRAVGVVTKASARYPYFLQEFASAAWDAARGPVITQEDALAAVHIGQVNLDRGFFTSRWERATRAEREYMRAMTEDGARPSQSGEIVRRLGRKSPSSLGPTRANLIHKGLVYAPDRGQVAFTVPGMAAFIRRHPD
jgi:type II secretory pathway predicted ATPase ExeA